MRFGVGAAIVTAAFHAALAVSVSAIPGAPKPRAPSVITIVDVPAPRSPAPPPPPPPPPAEAAPAVTPAPRAAVPPRAAPKAPPAKAAAATVPPPVPPPTYQYQGGGNGPAVGGGEAPADPTPPAPTPPKKKVLEAKPPPPPDDADPCADAIVKPKPIHVVQPVYTADAQAAGVEGKVRVEISIDAAGAVTGARVLEGLGHGLDEAALDAARASTFTPASRCGEAVATTFTIGMRFAKQAP